MKLEESDAEAGDLVAQIEARHGDDEFRGGVQAISQCIDDFEFDLALELLAKLRVTLGSTAKFVDESL